MQNDGEKERVSNHDLNFFCGHIVPATPPGQPDWDIKKTKYNKVSKFLTEKLKEGILTVKEHKKGVEVVSGIKKDHEKLGWVVLVMTVHLCAR